MDIISGLKLSLMNVNGLNSHQKQRNFLTYFKKEYSDIILVSDTRLKTHTEKQFINKATGYDIYSTLADGLTTKRGVSIMINKNLPLTLFKVNKELDWIISFTLKP